MNVFVLSGGNPNVSTHLHPLVPSCDPGASPSGLLGHISTVDFPKMLLPKVILQSPGTEGSLLQLHS